MLYVTGSKPSRTEIIAPDCVIFCVCVCVCVCVCAVSSLTHSDRGGGAGETAQTVSSWFVFASHDGQFIKLLHSDAPTNPHTRQPTRIHPSIWARSVRVCMCGEYLYVSISVCLFGYFPLSTFATALYSFTMCARVCIYVYLYAPSAFACVRACVHTVCVLSCLCAAFEMCRGGGLCAFVHASVFLSQVSDSKAK